MKRLTNQYWWQSMAVALLSEGTRWSWLIRLECCFVKPIITTRIIIIYYRQMGIWLCIIVSPPLPVHALPYSQPCSALPQNKIVLNKLLHRSLFASCAHISLSVLFFSTATILDLLWGISGKACIRPAPANIRPSSMECFHSCNQCAFFLTKKTFAWE